MPRALIPAAAVLAVGFTASTFAGDAAAGKAVFDGARPACVSCHSDTRNPLTKAGAENTVDELKAWVRTPKDMITSKGKKGMMPSYGPDKISDADLDNLVAYMATLK